MSPETLKTDVLIIGKGVSGLLLNLLLGRRGISSILLSKNNIKSNLYHYLRCGGVPSPLTLITTICNHHCTIMFHHGWAMQHRAARRLVNTRAFDSCQKQE